LLAHRARDDYHAYINIYVERERERDISRAYIESSSVCRQMVQTHTQLECEREKCGLERGPYCTVCCVWDNWKIKGLGRWPWQKRGGEYKSGSAAPAVHSMVIILIIFSTREREKEKRKKKLEKKNKKSGTT
jgi:hypothetical protein